MNVIGCFQPRIARAAMVPAATFMMTNYGVMVLPPVRADREGSWSTLARARARTRRTTQLHLWTE